MVLNFLYIAIRAKKNKIVKDLSLIMKNYMLVFLLYVL